MISKGFIMYLDSIHFVDCPSGISIVLSFGLLEVSTRTYTLLKLLRSYLDIQEL
jgi:hypothetical protein